VPFWPVRTIKTNSMRVWYFATKYACPRLRYLGSYRNSRSKIVWSCWHSWTTVREEVANVGQGKAEANCGRPGSVSATPWRTWWVHASITVGNSRTLPPALLVTVACTWVCCSRT